MKSLDSRKDRFASRLLIIDHHLTCAGEIVIGKLDRICFTYHYSKFALIALLCIGFALHAEAQSNEMSTKLAEICRKHDVPAMVAAVVNGQGLVAAECCGVRKRGTSDKVELSDRFPIGSNTKSMTAALATAWSRLPRATTICRASSKR